MKHLFVFLLLIGCIFMFSNCAEEEIISPDEDIIFRAGPDKRPFEGICTPVSLFPVNTWYDDTDDWRTTGTTIWTAISPTEGTCQLFVAPKNPHENNRGIWDMTYSLTVTPVENGMLLVGDVEGIGVEGKVDGLEASWTYTMNYVGTDFPNPDNETFFYEIEGTIYKPTGNE